MGCVLSRLLDDRYFGAGNYVCAVWSLKFGGSVFHSWKMVRAKKLLSLFGVIHVFSVLAL